MNTEAIKEELSAELELIDASDLRHKVVKAWTLACQMGGYDSISQVPTAGFDWQDQSLLQHVKDVTRIAVGILDVLKEMKVKLNRDYLVAGALCHDLGVPPEMRKNQSGFYTPFIGAQKAATFYGENANMPLLEPRVSYQVARHPMFGFYIALASGMPEHVAHIVGAHSREGDLIWRTPEASIVHTADMLWWQHVGGFGYPSIPEWRTGEPFHWRESDH